MQLIGYIRTPSRLMALVIQEVEIESNPEDKKLEFAEVPIQGVENETQANPALLIDSWEYLADRCPLNEETLFHIVVVLLETAPVFVSRKAPAVPETKAPKPFQATAAHPRAFKGTTHKPRKKPQNPRVENIQEHLCHPQTLKKLLQTLAPYWSNALDLLEQSGYQATALKTADFEVIDLYLAYHHLGYSKEPAEKITRAFY